MREEKRIEKFKQQLNEMAEVEERNKRERIRKTKDVQKHHLEQIEAKRENAAKELEEWKKEGAEIQQLTKVTLEMLNSADCHWFFFNSLNHF